MVGLLVELSLDQVNTVVAGSLKDTISTMEDMLKDNEDHHNGCRSGQGTFVPFFSYKYNTEKKKVTKMLKALKRVNGWYSND